MNIEKTINNLRKNNMVAIFVKDRYEALEKVKELLKEGSKVATGGSKTLEECGVLDLLRSGKYAFLDRYKVGLSKEERNDIFRESFFADFYITSSNALTEEGELYNVDGNGNRVSAMIYGPKEVIVLVGKNKITKNIDEAIKRVKEIAAPLNSERLDCKTGCLKNGKCISLCKETCGMTDGCDSDSRICCSYTVMARQRIKDRIKVIIADEELGF